MIISQKTSFLSEIEGKRPIPKEKLAFFQTRLQLRLYDLVVSKFREKSEHEGLTKAELARRIGRKPEVITRLLGNPGNCRIDTISDLLLGIGGEELDVTSTPLLNKAKRNFGLPEWATGVNDGNISKPASGLNARTAFSRTRLQLGAGE